MGKNVYQQFALWVKMSITRLSSDKRTINVNIYQQKCIFWLLEVHLEEVFGIVRVQESI